jgi:hypothetical protein
MRRRKWLIIIVAILLLINLIYFVLTRIVDIDAYIDRMISQRVGEQINADICFSDLIITPKSLQISGLEINDKRGNYSFLTSQLYLQYDFWKLIWSRFNILKAIETINLFSPTFSYEIQAGTEPGSFQLSDLEKILNQLPQVEIINGQVHIGSKQEDLVFDVGLEQINFTFENQKKNQLITLNAVQSKYGGTIDISGVYQKGGADLQILLNGIRLANCKIDPILIHDSHIDLSLSIKDSRIEKGELTLSQFSTEIESQFLTIKNVEFVLTDKEIAFSEPAMIEWNDNSVIASGKIEDYLEDNPQLAIAINSIIDIENFSNEAYGNLNVELTVQGGVRNPSIQAQLQSPDIRIPGQELTNISLNMIYQDGEILISSGRFDYLQNPVSIAGTLIPDFQELAMSQIKLKARTTDFSYAGVSAELDIDVSGNFQNPEILCLINGADILNETITLHNLAGEIKFYDGNIDLSLENNEQTIKISGSGSNILSNPKAMVELTTDGLVLKEISPDTTGWLNDFNPILSAQIKCSLEDSLISWDGRLVFNKRYDSFTRGEVTLSGFFNILEAQSRIQLKTSDLLIQEVPYNIDLQAHTFGDTVVIDTLSINDALVLSGAFQIPNGSPKPSWYNGKIELNNISFLAVTSAILPVESFPDVHGHINGSIVFDSELEPSITGEIYADSIAFHPDIPELNARLRVSLKDSLFNVDELLVTSDERILMNGFGTMEIYKPYRINFSVRGDSIDIAKDVFSGPLTGILNYEMLFTGTRETPNLALNVQLTDGEIAGIHYNVCKAQVFQDNEVLYVNEFYIRNGSRYELTVNGDYSYNFFTQEFSDISSRLDINLRGDFFALLADYVGAIKFGESEGSLKLTFITEDRAPQWEYGELVINDGILEIDGQPERIKDISIHLSLEDNRVFINECKAKAGDGKLEISNNFNVPSQGISIGGFELGVILATTDDNGILIHIPGYMPERSLANVKLRGKEDRYFRLVSDGDAWEISGKILVSNGKGLFPPQKGKLPSGGRGSDIFPPVHLDFDLVFEKNIRYVTRPFNLSIVSGSFIRFTTNPETDKVELYLVIRSRQGDMEFLGETFRAQEVEILMSKFDKLPRVRAIFTTKTPEGSTITLSIMSVEEDIYGENIRETEFGNFRISLDSDDPENETFLGILSKLQYGKNINQLTEGERRNLYRDEALLLAGNELGNILFEPVIKPVESLVRQFLDLDFFRLKTGFMGNIMRRSGLILTEDDYYAQDGPQSSFEQLSELSREILLDNLAIEMGKYIGRDWYVAYELMVRKDFSPDRGVSMGVEHEIVLRYDLPLNFQVTYLYRFSPLKEEELQRISLETVLHF